MKYVHAGLFAVTTTLAQVASPAAAADLTLRLGHHVPAEHSTNREFAQVFVDLVSEKSDGAIKVQNYPAGQLGGQRELLEGLELGTIDMSYADIGVVANYDLALGTLDLPYVFDNMDHAYRAMEDGLLDAVQARVADAGSFQVLGMIPVAFRDTLLAEKDVKTLDDLKGVKVRTPEAPVLIDTFRAQPNRPTTGSGLLAAGFDGARTWRRERLCAMRSHSRNTVCPRPSRSSVVQTRRTCSTRLRSSWVIAGLSW